MRHNIAAATNIKYKSFDELCGSKCWWSIALGRIEIFPTKMVEVKQKNDIYWVIVKRRILLYTVTNVVKLLLWVLEANWLASVLLDICSTEKQVYLHQRFLAQGYWNKASLKQMFFFCIRWRFSYMDGQLLTQDWCVKVESLFMLFSFQDIKTSCTPKNNRLTSIAYELPLHKHMNGIGLKGAFPVVLWFIYVLVKMYL